MNSPVWISLWALQANAGNPSNGDLLVGFVNIVALLVVIGLGIYMIWESMK